MTQKIVCFQGEFPALSATFILDQIVGLTERGLPIENWSTKRSEDSEVHAAVATHNLSADTRYMDFRGLDRHGSDAHWLRAFFKKNPHADMSQVEAMHVHYGSLFRRLEPVFRAWNGFLIVSFHGHDASRYVRVNGANCYQYLFERANLITTPSFAMKDTLVALGCPADKIAIHRYGIDLRRFRPAARRPSTDGTIRLLSVGRLVEKKGFEYSLRALAQLPDLTNVRYQIIGDGPLMAPLTLLVRELGLESHVEFLGAKNSDAVLDAMSDADVFVLTSVTAADGDQEGLPVTLIEAQAIGLPVVSSLHAGIPELVSDGHSGFLVAERDIAGIAAAMRRFVEDPALRASCSAHATERMRAEFNIERLNDQLAGYLRKGIAGAQIAPQAQAPALPKGEPLVLKDALAKIGWSPYLPLFDKQLDSAEACRPVTAPRASLILISWKFTLEALQTMQALHGHKPADVEIVFVNNGAPDEEMGAVKGYANKYIRLNNNTGAYLARNIGAAFAEGHILIFVDDDGMPAPNFVQAHLEAFERYDAVAVRGRVLPKRQDISKEELCLSYSHYDRGRRPFPDFPNVEGNSSFRAEAFHRIGGWDNQITFGGGGLDISIRLLQVQPNFRTQIYYPDAVLYHDPKTGAASESKVERQAASRKRLAAKHPQWNFFREFWEIYRGREDLLIRTASRHAPDPAAAFGVPAVPGKVNLYEKLAQRNWRGKTPLYEMSFERAELITDRVAPAVSVVVVAWAFTEAIADNLRALAQQNRDSVEIIFVNNGGSDEDFSAIKPLVDVYVKLTTNTGAYLSRNIGSVFASAPVLLFLDDDAMPGDDLVAAHQRAFESYDVIAVRGMVRPRTASPLNALAKHYDLGDTPFPVFADIEGNTSYAASAFFRVGGWDDQIRFGGGGVELSIRLFDQVKDPRKQIYSPGPVIYHDYVASQEHLDSKRAKQEESRARLRGKYPFYDKYLQFWGQFRGRSDVLIKRVAS